MTQDEPHKKTLCVDFDGVLHSYTSGWQGTNIVADGPVPGAIDWLQFACKFYTVCIYSSRSKSPGGIAAMQSAIYRWALEEQWAECAAKELVDGLQFPDQKPAAWLTIDDRCICFNGTFPLRPDIDTFKPWNKRE